MKLYGIRYLEDDESVWSDFYAFSQEVDKLRSIVKGINYWMVGSYDVTNNPREKTYTDRATYPVYSIVEVPFVV